MISKVTSSGQVKSGSAGQPGEDAITYKKLYWSKVVADLSMNTAVLKRIDQGDYQTAKKVLMLRLNSDLQLIASVTNYPWSEEENKARELAEQYRKQHENVR
jgi:hypothetical protein